METLIFSASTLLILSLLDRLTIISDIQLTRFTQDLTTSLPFTMKGYIVKELTLTIPNLATWLQASTKTVAYLADLKSEIL